MSRIIDPWMQHAIDNIKADYGVDVRMEYKNKDLLKFGRHENVQTTKTTLMTLPSGIYNETFLSANSITSIISTSTADGETVTIEGHTSADGLTFVFVTQTKVLTGQTVATLDTALCRCSRIYNSSATELAGTVSVCETDTYASGVPVTPAGVHCQIRAGEQQTEKASTTISSVDYWVITSFYGDMLEKAAAFGEVDLEVRLSGKVFRPIADIGVGDTHNGRLEFKPYLVIPPNSDVRLRALVNANGKDVSGGIEGVLLKAAA